MKTVEFEVKAEDREVLESWLRSKTIPQALGMRARVVLLSGEGSSLRSIAQQLRLTERTVCLWRRRYQQEGVGGLRSRRRSGRPRRITRAKEFAVVTATSRLAPGRDPLERAAVGQTDGRQLHDRAPDLAQVRSAAPSSRDFQVQYRPAVRPQTG